MTSFRALMRHSFDLRSRSFERFGHRSRFLSRTVGGVGTNSSFGLFGLDQRLIKRINKRKGFFIELGANDGVAQSNTLTLELVFGWRGILVEPVSDTFSILRKNRNRCRNHLVRAACVSFDFPGDDVDIALSNLMSTPLVASSDVGDVREHVLGKDSQPGDRVSVESVPARTLTSVLEEAHAPKAIDLLSLDVEGGELEVLLGIDFSKYNIDWILVESRKVTVLTDLLEDNGYELIEQMTHHDFLFRRRPGFGVRSPDFPAEKLGFDSNN